MKKIFIGIVIFFIALSFLLVVNNKTIKAQDQTDSSADMLKRLDDISKTQKDILQNLASIQNELGIIKIRVTQQQ